MSITLRIATAADALALLEIQREASLAAFRHIFAPSEYPFPSEQVLQKWQEPRPELIGYSLDLSGLPREVPNGRDRVG